MSYLDPVRMHFAGRFQADPSTVNNDPTHFDNAHFQPSYQQQGPSGTNGWWNPDGSGSYRLIDCRVTRVCYGDGTTTSDPLMEPVVGMRVADADRRVAGKLVDLDPQQQMVSEIWGLVVRLMNGSSDVFAGPFEVAAFTDLWKRATQVVPGHVPLGAYYQSVIGPVVWGETNFSRFLRELRARAEDGTLSIKFNVDGYVKDWTLPDFTIGRIVGTIGPAYANEPRHFVIGRQLGGTGTQVNYMTCVVDPETRRLTADFGNALPTTKAGGPLLDIGDLSIGWVDSATTTFKPIGTVAYRDSGWYESTAGVQVFDLPEAARAPLASRPVALQSGSGILLQENLDGLHARADRFVYRIYPGERADVTIYATQYGVLQDGAPIVVSLDPSQLQGDQTTPPVVALPTTAIGGFDPNTPIVAKNGVATVTITSSDPENPRGYIDGQVYGVRCLPKAIAEALAQKPPVAGVFENPWDFVSVLIWNEYTAPSPITWFDNLQPIFTQYGHLYPIMDKLIDLTQYESVAANAGILSFVFSLPVHDPNSMPVTRDLSPAKRAAILEWLKNPLRGTAAPKPVPAAKVSAPPPVMNRLQALKSGRIDEGEE